MWGYSVNCHHAYVQSAAGFPVIGPILFSTLRTCMMSDIESHGLSPDTYADDTHVSGFCRSAAVDGFFIEDLRLYR